MSVNEKDELKIDVEVPCRNNWYGNHTFEMYRKEYRALHGYYKEYIGKRCILCGVIKETNE